MYSKVLIIGRVVNDPSIRYSPSGKAVVNLSIAVDRYRSEKVETDFFDVVAFEREAERADKFLRKGRLVMIEGRLQTREFENQDGSKRKIYEIIVETFRMLDRKPDDTNFERDSSIKETKPTFDKTDKKSIDDTEYRKSQDTEYRRGQSYDKKFTQSSQYQKSQKSNYFDQEDEIYQYSKPKKEKPRMEEDFDELFFDDEE
jgi:single-strand DNA-binding protein